MAAVDHPPVTTRTRRLLAVLLVPLLAAAVAGAAAWWPDGSGDRPGAVGRPADATVVAVREITCADTSPEAGIDCIRLEVLLDGGGRVAVEELDGTEVRPPTVGDEVVVARVRSGSDIRYELEGLERSTPLGVAAIVAAVALLMVARWRGLRLLAALALTAIVLVAFAIPALLDGAPPGGVAAVAGAAVATALVLAGRGIDARHLTALIGSLLGVAAAAGITVVLTGSADLAGLDRRALPLDDLLVVGMVVGATGALVDLAVRLVDATWDLRDTDVSAGWFGIARAGIRRARDTYTSAAATLTVAYAGVALPVLLTLLSDRTLVGSLETEELAVEVVRGAVGVLALGSVVPLTATVAAAVIVLESRKRGPDDPRRFRSRKERDIWG